MSEHKARFVEAVAAEVDEQVVTLVEALTTLGVLTISSCQGNPGIIGEGGSYGHVAFTVPLNTDWQPVGKFLFDFLRPFVQHMWDDVRLEMTCSEQNGFIGWIYFRNEALEDLSKRIGVYCEMTHRS